MCSDLARASSVGGSMSGIMTARMPAACAAMMPMLESSKATQWAGATPSRARGFEVDVGRGLGVLGVVARRDDPEAVEQAGAAEIALRRLAVGRGGDGERQTSRSRGSRATRRLPA